MELDSKFTFGMYKGLTLQEVYQGTLTLNRRLLQAFLNKILNDIHPYLPKSFHFEFIEKFVVTENTIEIIGTQEFWETGIDARGNSIGKLDEVYLGNIQDILKQIISYHFNDNWLGVLETVPAFNALQAERKVIGGDPQYLLWCMKEVEGFHIHEKAMSELEKLPFCEFSGIDIMYKKHNSYEYTPIMNVRQSYFQELDIF
jgi:hypothetical protein